jgi:hypothetical protein
MGLIEDLEALRNMEARDVVYIHYEIIPFSSPPFLACLCVGSVVIRPHIMGFPASLRRILTNERVRKVVSNGPFEMAVVRQFMWGFRDFPNLRMMPRQYHAMGESFFWGDAVYTEEALAYLRFRVNELREWDNDALIDFKEPPQETKRKLDRIDPPINERNTVAKVTVCKVRHRDGTPFYPVNLMNLNLTSYLNSYTFTPPDRVYQDWVASTRYITTASIAETARYQGMNHGRMLARGSTQINTCTNAVTVGTFVRVDQRVLRKPEDYAQDLYGDSVNGTVPWSDKVYKVVKVIDGTDTSPRKYVLQDMDREFFRGFLCPIENLEIGAIVRIRLSTIAKWLMANGTVKVKERHFKYNHTYSRALFKIAEVREVDTEGKKFFLDLIWDPTKTFKYAEWEVDEAQNLWSISHINKKIGARKFSGFWSSDLLRVDQQTEVLMRTADGQEKYRECLLKCMNLGHKATYLNDTTEKKRMKKDRVRLPKAASKKNEELRKLLLEGLFDPPEIFSFVE